jgi:cell division protease FtsH
MSENQQPQRSGGRWINIILFALALLVVFAFLYNSLFPPSKAVKISENQFYELIGLNTETYSPDEGKIEFHAKPTPVDPEAPVDPDAPVVVDRSNQIAAIVWRGNEFYILLENNAMVIENNWKEIFFGKPENADYVFMTPNVIKIDNIISAQIAFAQDKPLENIIVYQAQEPLFPWMEQLLPYVLLFIVCGLLGFFLFRMLAGRNSSLAGMTRNRATRTINGPTRFSDVAGIDEEKEEVKEIVQFLRSPERFSAMGARIPKGVLLVGAPGTGKTLLAKAIAGEAGVPFFSISGSDFSEMLVGVGPSRMRDLFNDAKASAPCIIFFDEIDSIAKMRGVGASGVSEENEQTLNQLLVQMDGFTKTENVIVLAATNRPDVLDPALLRPGRFDRQIIVQMPDVKGREQILKVHSRTKPLNPDIDFKRIAQITSGFSGADLENLMNESAIIAAKKEKKKISMQDVTEGINKVLLGPQKRSRIITDKDKKITAYHESGHAIVARLLQKDQVVQEVSIIPRGMAAGYTLTNDAREESHHRSKSFLSAEIAVFMSGRVAESIFIGDTSTGCSHDLKVATDIAESMVTKYGMSEKLGPLYYGKEDEIALRMYNSKQTSEQLQSIIDSEIRAIITNAEKTARDILTKYKTNVEVMTEVLLDCETIYSDDITLILEGKNAETVLVEKEKRERAAKEQEKKEQIGRAHV